MTKSRLPESRGLVPWSWASGVAGGVGATAATHPVAQLEPSAHRPTCSATKPTLVAAARMLGGRVAAEGSACASI